MPPIIPPIYTHQIAPTTPPPLFHTLISSAKAVLCFDFAFATTTPDYLVYMQSSRELQRLCGLASMTSSVTFISQRDPPLNIVSNPQITCQP